MHISGLDLLGPLLCLFSEVQNRHQIQKYIIDVDLFCTISFRRFSSFNMTESETSVSAWTHMTGLPLFSVLNMCFSICAAIVSRSADLVLTRGATE